MKRRRERPAGAAHPRAPGSPDSPVPAARPAVSGALLPALALVLLAAAAYSGALSNGFLWDDEILVQSNVLIRSLARLPDIFSSSFFAGGATYYRPLPIASYAVDFALWGLDPRGFHLTNLLLHVCIVLTFFSLLRRRFTPAAAFWTAALFCVHPLNSKIVAAVFDRPGLLEGLVVGAFLAFEAAPRRRGAGVLSCILFALALLAKESALVFPFGAWVFSRLYFSPEERASARPVLAALAALAAAYVAARWAWMPFQSAHPLSLIADQTLPWRAWTFFKSLLLYAGLLVFPLRLYTERNFVVTSLLDPWPWLGLLALGGAWAAALRRRQDRPEFAFGLAWLCAGLLPTSNIVPLPITMAEHWVYLPSLGLYWMAAAALSRVPPQEERLRRGVPILLAAALAAAVVRTRLRVADWKDGPTLYRRDLRWAPNSFLLHNNLGVELFRAGRLEEAAVEFEAAYRLEPRYGTTISNLGVIRERKGDLPGAERAYREAIAASDYELAYVNLVKMELRLGKSGEARKVLTAGRAHYPFNEELLSLAGILLSSPR